MPFVQVNTMKYLVFESFTENGIAHGIFTRNGGISPSPWNTLNVGGTVGDDPSKVVRNRKSMFEALGLEIHSSFDVWQVHSNRVVCANSPRDPQKNIQKADAVITNVPGVTLFMRFADCVPILFYDPIHKAIGIAHAGWKGTLDDIALETVNAMQANFDSSPSEIFTSIGPSIACHHYEIGDDVLEQVEQRYGNDAEKYILNSEIKNSGYTSKPFFDLQKANQHNLLSAGVQFIEISDICTACNLDDWFSHRGENGKTGRFGALITL